MDSHRANAEIILSNGDIQARNFSKTLKLKLEFGSASLQDIENAQLTINYSDITCGNLNTLNLSSRSSTIEIEETGALEITSSRDKLVIKSCASIIGDASFSRIRINELGNMCTMETQYGELRLNSLSRNFRSIQIKSQYTDIFLGIITGTNYSMDLLYDAKTNLNISAPINSQLKKETLNDKSGTIQASGDIGKAGTSHISVSAKAGALSLLNK